jgi:hypothetical protein
MGPSAGVGQVQFGGARQVRFADANDGWVFDPDLWATHDGGAHWEHPALPGVAATVEVQALEAAAGMVYAVVLDTTGVHIEGSPVSREGWELSPTTVSAGAGPIPRAQLVLQGSAGWLVETDRVVVGGARGEFGVRCHRRRRVRQ